MNRLVLGIVVTGVLSFSTQVGAGPVSATHAQMMKSCMNKQKSESSKMPAADMKRFCMDAVKEQKVSTGPETGTIDKPHQ